MIFTLKAFHYVLCVIIFSWHYVGVQERFQIVPGTLQCHFKPVVYVLLFFDTKGQTHYIYLMNPICIPYLYGSYAYRSYVYRDYLKEHPGLNERSLRMSAPLHS